MGEALADRTVADLPALLAPGDLLVVNDTKVIPAQLDARRGAARIGVTLDRPLPDGSWHAIARNARRVQPGDVLDLQGTEMRAAVVARDGGDLVLRFDQVGAAFADALRRAGVVGAAALHRPPGRADGDG